MNKLPICCGLIAALGFAGAALCAGDRRSRRTRTPHLKDSHPAKHATEEAQDVREASETTPSTSTTEGRRRQDAAGKRADCFWSHDGSSAAEEGPGQKLVGASVVTRTNAPLGQVTEVVFDSKQQPAFVIISTEDQSSAVPYAAASSMMSGDKVVIDQSKLRAAPKLKQGEWKHQSDAKWQADAARYWNRG